MADRRLFFALWPSQRQRELLVDGVAPMLSAVQGRHVDRGNWHVTLVFIGDFPEERIDELLSAAGAVDPGEIRLRFDGLSFWRKPRVACLRAKSVPAELRSLVRNLQRLLIRFGYAPDPRDYRPHITVARKVRPFAETPLARPIDLSWSEFELVESVPVPGGVRYSPVKQ